MSLQWAVSDALLVEACSCVSVWAISDARLVEACSFVYVGAVFDALLEEVCSCVFVFRDCVILFASGTTFPKLIPCLFCGVVGVVA